MHLFNTPPLKGRKFKRVIGTERISKVDMTLFNAELQAMKWEHGESQWSKDWGRMLTDMSRDIQKLKSCCHPKYYEE